MSFTVKGCIIKIDFLFILMLAFSALFSAKELLSILLFSSLHEVGHLFVLLLCGGRAEMLCFSYFGLALRYKDELSKIGEAAVLFAGPAVNLIFYCILRDDVNLILFALNILPIYPLDGGRLVKLFFHKASKFISVILLIMIYFLSFYLIIANGSFSLLLISLYLTVYSLKY